MSRTLSSRLTRAPRPFSPEAAQSAEALTSGLDAPLAEVLRGALSGAPYLMGLMEKEADWFRSAAEDPEQALQDCLREIAVHSADGLGSHLRQSKRRVALLTAIADLGGAWSLEEVTGALTNLADAATGAALRAALAYQIRRKKITGLTEDALDEAGGMVVFAMGKMGAGELNYSSDIDLICLFDETRFDPEDFHEVRTGFVRATRAMCATLSEITGEGYVFRTDLRLRPDPAVTPVCMAMEAAERYYESLGRTWERAAYIKARPAVGDLKAGARFIDALRPFVWRRHLDFAAIQDAHDMRLAIREHKGLGGSITLPGHNMKLGRGGIREIEFFTQTRQLIAGGRDPDLRPRGTCEGLAVLADKGWVPPDVAATLTDHYRAHRTVEHRLQMVRDAQTHDLPQSPEGFARLAALMDRDLPELERDLRGRLEEVHELTEGFFAATKRPATPQTEAPDHAFDETVLERWPSYPALRSSRASDIFARLRPGLLARLAEAAKPDEALLAIDGFLAGLPAGVQLFSLLDSNPQLSALLIDVVSTSPALAAYLSRNAGVFDAVIAGDFFSPWPGGTDLSRMLSETLAREPDYEARLDGARRWAREWHFRVGVHLLRGITDAETAGRQYADLAEAVLAALWPVVIDNFAAKHGPPPGRGAVIVGMGSLGAGQLTATSDLDMLVIYDDQGQEASTGKRPLGTRPYFARLTQAMITAMTAPMSQGRLYEVDMRLRPSGNQGPVATSLASFDNYQRNEAWVWEHLALTRARVVAGPEPLAAEVTALIGDLLKGPRHRAEVLRQVGEMRARIAGSKAPEGPWDAKIGAGRLQDIELFAQACALLEGTSAFRIRDVFAGPEARALAGEAGAAHLQEAYAACWRLQCAGRLLSSRPRARDALGQAGAQFLARQLDMGSIETAETRMIELYSDTARIIEDAIAPHAGRDEREKP